MAFDLFSLLGSNFSPRFRDLADQRFRWAETSGVGSGGLDEDDGDDGE
ncbi:hypothetical protein [Streptomyces broussonetiae]